MWRKDALVTSCVRWSLNPHPLRKNRKGMRHPSDISRRDEWDSGLEGSGGGNEDAGGFAGAGFGADEDINVAVEGGEEVHEAFDGEAGELVVAEGGDFGLMDAQGARGGDLRGMAGGEDAIDGEGQADLGLFLRRIGKAEVGKDVAGAGDDWRSIFGGWHIAPHSRLWLGGAVGQSVAREKSKAPHVKTTCGPPQFSSGVTSVPPAEHRTVYCR